MPEPPARTFRKPPRIPGFDYTTPGIYFLTIRTRNMECRFGEVRGGQMRLNDAARLVEKIWRRNVGRYVGGQLDAFVVMPNHVHGILFIGTDPKCEPPSATACVQSFKWISTIDYGRGVRAGRFPAYETALWQRSFYDRILRDERDLEVVRNYIEGNPARWEERRGVHIP